jgi:hypothetical protein
MLTISGFGMTGFGMTGFGMTGFGSNPDDRAQLKVDGSLTKGRLRCPPTEDPSDQLPE